MSEIKDTLSQRGNIYGTFESNAKTSQFLKSVIPDDMDAICKEGLEMIFHKIARIVNGDPMYDDSWHDIAGYATLVENHVKNR